ncbi:MAG: heme o synthase [Solirubrobacterales bacterium]|nr:heme o synthase [Solirubrobacterales bacterium]MCB8915693.1 protoheme IX farnesyltransferase [Thermoleophilales bacterium]
MSSGADARAVRPRQAAQPAQSGLQLDLIPLVRDYVSLTKPRIISLLLLTTVATMFVADPSGPALSTILWTMLGGYMAAGGAGAINHYIDRNRDARNNRTKDRPLADGRIKPVNGLIFGIALGAIAFFQLWLTVNFLAAALAMVGLFGYVFLYTLWLKPLTPQNIVIGGSAGAVPPLVGWAAASGGLTWEAMWPFLIIFFWTPPHFWALSLMIKDDYAKTGVPMLPVVKGEEATRQSILIYTIFMVGFTVGPYCTGLVGPFYLAASVVLGLVYIGFSFMLWRRPGPKITLQSYLYSLAYLALLFISMAVAAVAAA